MSSRCRPRRARGIVELWVRRRYRAHLLADEFAASRVVTISRSTAPANVIFTSGIGLPPGLVTSDVEVPHVPVCAAGCGPVGSFAAYWEVAGGCAGGAGARFASRWTGDFWVGGV